MRSFPSAAHEPVTFQAEVINNRDGKADGELRLNLPAGWKATPAAHELHFTRAGERAQFRFAVAAPSRARGLRHFEAVARVDGQEYQRGLLDHVGHRDLETRYLYRKAAATVRGVDVKVHGWTEGRLRDGHRRRGAGGARAAGRRRAAARRTRAGGSAALTVRRDLHRHARVCGAGGSEDLQSPAAGLRPRAAAT